jgi:phosphohistidine phosphatase
MRRLILFRHAKSDHIKGIDDLDRPLAERGREASPRMGQYLKDEGLLPDLVLVSPAARTRETWDLARPPLEPVAMRIEPRIYESPGSQLFDIVREVEADAKVLMLVGHNPGMHELATKLVGHGDRYAFARLRQKYPTAGIAVLDFDIEGWGEVAERGGRLDRFVVPKDLGIDADD